MLNKSVWLNRRNIKSYNIIIHHALTIALIIVAIMILLLFIAQCRCPKGKKDGTHLDHDRRKSLIGEKERKLGKRKR